MIKCLTGSLALAAASVAFAQGPSAVDFANMREDVQGLTQKVAELSLRIEQLEHENSELRGRVQGGQRDTVTLSQLNSAVADLNAAIQSATASSRKEILGQVGIQMEKLARQTNAALDALSKAEATPAPTVSSAHYTETAAPQPPASSKEAGSYMVQKGDTLALIAKRTGVRFQDIVEANKLSDPSKIRVGQTLLIPGGK